MRLCRFNTRANYKSRIHHSQSQPFVVEARRHANRKGHPMIKKMLCRSCLSIAGIALVLSTLLTAHGVVVAAEPDAGERAAIAKTIDTYIDGGRNGSSEVMRKAFHDGATIYTATAGGPIQLLYDLIDGKPPANDIPYSITNLDMTGTIAMARVEIDDWAGTRYSDMFTLVKVGDDWKIVSKVSYKH